MRGAGDAPQYTDIPDFPPTFQISPDILALSPVIPDLSPVIPVKSGIHRFANERKGATRERDMSARA